MINGIESRPGLRALIEKQLALWPEHATYLGRSFADRSPAVLDVSEQVSGLILKLAHHMPGGLDGLCKDYRYLCEEITLPEELYFRRNGAYRLSKFTDAFNSVYANKELMSRYMAGLLVSDVLWSPHAHAFEYYVNKYLPGLPAGCDHLEIGPGHGLFLFFAAQRGSIGKVVGWDISPASVEATRTALEVLGADRKVEVKLQDLFAKDRASGQFGSVVLSEILEHLEDPVAALRSVYDVLRPGGWLWINVPANSPAPDHLYLLRTPEEACDLATQAGFEVTDHAFYPMTGATLEKARKHSLSISCVITARRPS